jgi:hypothetical protein
MNAFFTTVYRDLSCGAAAIVITAVLAGAFVQSTSTAPGTHIESGRMFALQTTHGWFGQPEPAVLVD